ncbi:MAG: serine/threonine protein kinase [Haliea sp.]|nr:MAG: serine/threonine protein kinase [Haliea sp.]
MTVLPPSTPVSLITHADALVPGTRLAEFELLGVLGAGGFGMVYQAFDHSLQRPVAIKEYIPAALAGRGPGGVVIVRDPADQPAFAAGLQSFVAEARLLAQFDHPSLVKVFRYWEGHQTAYMVMPLYRGMTLQAARSQMRMPPTEAWLRKVLWAVLGALKTLHHGSAVHRDVSPDNIFLQDSGPPVLLDLGAARHAIGGKTQDLTDAFKLSYAPLEQHAGDPEMRQGPWTDLYALAAVVHGLLCNKPPLPATFRAVRDRLPPFARVARTVQEQFGLGYSPAFVQAVGQALAIEPKERPQTVAAMVQAMGLETPNGMSRFDWRAELGAIWMPPGVPALQRAAVRMPPVQAEAVSAARVAGEATQPLVPPARRREPPAGDVRIAATSSSSRLRWRVGAGVAALLVVGGLTAAFINGRGAVPQAPLLASAADAPAAHVQANAPAGLAAPPEPPPIAAVSLSPATAASATAAPKRAPRPKSLQAEAGGSSATVLAPVAVAAVPAVAARAEPSAAPALTDPRVQCADSSFLGKPLCIYRQCQKPGMAALPVCVENNAQMQNTRKFEGF